MFTTKPLSVAAAVLMLASIATAATPTDTRRGRAVVPTLLEGTWSPHHRHDETAP